MMLSSIEKVMDGSKIHANFVKQCDLAPFRSVILQYRYREPTLKFHKEQNETLIDTIACKIKICKEATLVKFQNNYLLILTPILRNFV